MKTIWAWLCKNWFVPLVFLSITLGWVLSSARRKKGTPTAQTKVELAAMDAQAEVKRLQATNGALFATNYVNNVYQTQLASLTADQKKQAEVLLANPAKLAAYLVRVGGS